MLNSNVNSAKQCGSIVKATRVGAYQGDQQEHSIDCFEHNTLCATTPCALLSGAAHVCMCASLLLPKFCSHVHAMYCDALLLMVVQV